MENKLYPSYLSGADGIRAIACLAVIFHHLTQRLSMHDQTTVIQESQAFLLVGNAGVSVFFVLSGFLLSLPFWKRYLGDGQFPEMGQYVFRRAARIVPGFYVAFMISTLLAFLWQIPTDYQLIRILTGLTFTSGFHYNTLFPSEINGPLWSISFEVFCYLLMPIFMLGLFFLGKRRSFRKAITYWVGVVLFIVCLNQLIHLFLTPDNIQRGWEYGLIGGAKYWMPNYNPIGFFGQFAFGIIASAITIKLFLESKAIEVFKRKGGFDVISFIGLAVSFYFLWHMRHLGDFSFSLQNQPYYFPIYPILVAVTLSTVPHSLWFGKLLDNRVLRFTAKVSFGLYIWHYLVITVVERFWVTDYYYMGLADFNSWLLVSSVILVTSYVVATLSFYLVEKPVLDWSHRKRFPGRRIQDLPGVRKEA
ncbi:acyltransferase family protein [Halalkalibacter akibai]|uniref:Putative acyltransferase protein n=1 Tax=Halalkalibacter akibai (strain ATCC 43226 / DSM 21942 / CIP 109018 / JCM 9157 / 1139) TaxID=1236973 RepID=W4QV43_HALA3|nr:acyltransferase [Halalkalibacter akibai]GAE35951.1 putative acyltransferase protein [Halalkalibacter akibai JCM 9157]